MIEDAADGRPEIRDATDNGPRWCIPQVAVFRAPQIRPAGGVSAGTILRVDGDRTVADRRVMLVRIVSPATRLEREFGPVAIAGRAETVACAQ